ncbi:MAG: hypothetical protein KAY32_14200 [Candidatus Eisenbacteria sp.]|nr:hypothetical protein [Candidatus Eisenbacteria bacterium]
MQGGQNRVELGRAQQEEQSVEEQAPEGLHQDDDHEEQPGSEGDEQPRFDAHQGGAGGGAKDERGEEVSDPASEKRLAARIGGQFLAPGKRAGRRRRGFFSRHALTSLGISRELRIGADAVLSYRSAILPPARGTRQWGMIGHRLEQCRGRSEGFHASIVATLRFAHLTGGD